MAPKEKKVGDFVRKTNTLSKTEESMGPQISGRNSGSIYLKKIKMLKRRMLKLHQENLLLKAANEQLVMKTNETTLNTANIAEARNILLTDSFNLMVEYNRAKEDNNKMREVINVLSSDLRNAMSHLGNLSITLINATQYATLATSEQPNQDNQESDTNLFPNNYPDQRSRGPKSIRVSPMVRGMPIQSPTIKLRRVQVPPTEYDHISVNEARLSRHETRMAEGPRYENPLSPIVEEEEEGPVRRKKGRLGHRFNNRRSFQGPRQVSAVSATDEVSSMNLEPVVRLRDVSTLLNNSSLCTLPQERKEWVEVEEEGVEVTSEKKKEGGSSGEDKRVEGDSRAGEGCSWWQYQPSSSPVLPTSTAPVSSSQPSSVLNETYNIEEKSLNISVELPETVNILTSPVPSTSSNSKLISNIEVVSPGVNERLTPVVEVSAIKFQNNSSLVISKQDSSQEIPIVISDSTELWVNKRRGNRKAVLENYVPEASSTPLVSGLKPFTELSKSKRTRKNTGSSSSSDFKGFTNSTEELSQVAVSTESSVMMTRSRSKQRKRKSTEDCSRESSATSNKVQVDQCSHVRKSSRARKPIDYKEKLAGKLRRE